MENRWQKTRIKDFAEIRGGGTPSRKVAEYFGGNVPWLVPSDLTDYVGRYVSRGKENLTQKGLNNSSARLLPEETVLFSSRATIGRVALAANPVSTNQGFRSLICDNQIALPQFVFYLMQYYTPMIESIAAGSTYKEISGSDLGEIEVRLPPLPIQRKIAAILSAYDDLIENNKRRIAILEEIAERLYREWFVHFRFPGHEDVPMVDSELGEIPEGWEVRAFSEVAAFQNGYGFSGEHWQEEGKPIVKISELREGVNSKTSFYHGDDIAEKYHINSGDLLFSWSASLVTRLWPYGPALLNQHLFQVIPQEGYCEAFLFRALNEQLQAFRNRMAGTTMTHIKRSALDEVNLVVPPARLREIYTKIVARVDDLIINLYQRNRLLRKTRDLLLPRLVSGQLEIDKLD